MPTVFVSSAYLLTEEGWTAGLAWQNSMRSCACKCKGGSWCAHLILSGARDSVPHVDCVEFKKEDHV